RSDPLIRDALQTVLDRGDFVRERPDEGSAGVRPVVAPAGDIATDPTLVAGLIERNQASIADLKRDIQTKSGPALLDFILADIQELKALLFDPQSHQAIMAGREAPSWLHHHPQAGVGGENAAPTTPRSPPPHLTPRRR